MQFPDLKVYVYTTYIHIPYFLFFLFLYACARTNAHVHLWGFRGFRGSPAMARKSRGAKSGVTEIGRGYAVAVKVVVEKKLRSANFFIDTLSKVGYMVRMTTGNVSPPENEP